MSRHSHFSDLLLLVLLLLLENLLLVLLPGEQKNDAMTSNSTLDSVTVVREVAAARRGTKNLQATVVGSDHALHLGKLPGLLCFTLQRKTNQEVARSRPVRQLWLRTARRARSDAADPGRLLRPGPPTISAVKNATAGWTLRRNGLSASRGSSMSGSGHRFFLSPFFRGVGFRAQRASLLFFVLLVFSKMEQVSATACGRGRWRGAGIAGGQAPSTVSWLLWTMRITAGGQPSAMERLQLAIGRTLLVATCCCAEDVAFRAMENETRDKASSYGYARAIPASRAYGKHGRLQRSGGGGSRWG
jgi:hypothetical protein